jgi:hypothetical protein
LRELCNSQAISPYLKYRPLLTDYKPMKKKKRLQREAAQVASKELAAKAARHALAVQARATRPHIVSVAPAATPGSGRITAGSHFNFFGPFATITPPSEKEQTWRVMELDDRTFSRMPVGRLVELMVDLSPDISKAVWDLILFVNPGHEFGAYKDADCKVKDERATQALHDYTSLLKKYYGSFDVVLARLTISGALRGAFFAEAVLDERADLPVDLVTPDPHPIRFRVVESGGPRGKVWEVGQWVLGRWVSYDYPTIKYIPIHPFPDSPYGRPLISPAIFSALFLLSLLRDLKRVVQQQGYPRIDISANLEKLQAAMPAEIRGDTEEEAAWINAAIEEVKAEYKKLQPDDAFVHLDIVDINRPVGTVDSHSLGAVGELMKALERMLVRALKSMPLLMGTTDGVSEANANRQWEIHAAGIKSLQHLLETLLETLFGVVLQAQGLPAYVKFRFSELRAAELLRDEQYRMLKFRNEAFAYYMGWQDNDQAAQAAVGQDAVAEAPIQAPATNGGSAGTVNPDPGADRVVVRLQTNKGTIRIEGRRDGIIPDGADSPLLPVPGTVTITDDEFTNAIEAWDAEGVIIDGLNSTGIIDASVVGD